MKPNGSMRETLDPVRCLTLEVVVWFGASVAHHNVGQSSPNRGMIRACRKSSWQWLLLLQKQDSRAPPKKQTTTQDVLLDGPVHRGTNAAEGR